MNGSNRIGPPERKSYREAVKTWQEWALIWCIIAVVEAIALLGIGVGWW